MLRGSSTPVCGTPSRLDVGYCDSRRYVGKIVWNPAPNVEPSASIEPADGARNGKPIPWTPHEFRFSRNLLPIVALSLLRVVECRTKHLDWEEGIQWTSRDVRKVTAQTLTTLTAPSVTCWAIALP
jgi:hypothetical protein